MAPSIEIVERRSYRRLFRDLWDGSPSRAVGAAVAAALLLPFPVLLLIASGVGAYYLGESGTTERVVGAATLVAIAGLVAEAIRRWRPWLRAIWRHASRYEHRKGDRAYQLEVDAEDLRDAKAALKDAGFMVDVPYWRTTEAVPFDARWRAEHEPAKDPPTVLQEAGIPHRVRGTSVSLGPTTLTGDAL